MQMKLQPKDGLRVVDAIDFNHFREAATADKSMPPELNCLYRLDVKEWNGLHRLQLLVDRMDDGRNPFLVQHLSDHGKPFPT